MKTPLLVGSSGRALGMAGGVAIAQIAKWVSRHFGLRPGSENGPTGVARSRDFAMVIWARRWWFGRGDGGQGMVLTLFCYFVNQTCSLMSFSHSSR
ncbi:MAG: hypothetical protein LBI02_08955 [Opitutaceae bacterium]|jgi:hypothetical protein|nr:hypothetical protein [Opitutaceae bacterium]